MYQKFSILFAAIMLTTHTINAENIAARKKPTSLNMEYNGEIAFIRSRLSSIKNPIVIDVGANKGIWSRAALKANRSATIYALEPGPCAFNTLSQTFNSSPNVHCFKLGLSDVEKNAIFYTYDHITPNGNPLNSLYINEDILKSLNTEPKKTFIDLSTLDLFCHRNNLDHIDLLKIDTEGEELNILKGGDQLLSFGKIDAIQFEYGMYYKEAGSTLEEVYHYLSSKGYDIYFLHYRGRDLIASWNPKLEDYAFSNYVAIYRN